MEPKSELPKLPEMVMCGDHPSFTKTELNAKEPGEEKEIPLALPCPKLSSTSCRERAERGRARASGHALRPRHAERAALGDVAQAQAHAHSAAIVQAALGSFRWPPYLLAVWVVVLLLTHALHCLVGCLERALPTLRKFCEYLRSLAERSWSPAPGGRVYPAALAALTGLCYAVYFALYLVHCVALWAVEPLAEEPNLPKVTDYEEATRSDASL